MTSKTTASLAFPRSATDEVVIVGCSAFGGAGAPVKAPHGGRRADRNSAPVSRTAPFAGLSRGRGGFRGRAKRDTRARAAPVAVRYASTIFVTVTLSPLAKNWLAVGGRRSVIRKLCNLVVCLFIDVSRDIFVTEAPIKLLDFSGLHV